MALDKVKPLKLESIDTGGDQDDPYPNSLDPNEDYIECRGLVLDDATHTDESTVIDRDNLDMRFKDGNNPSGFTLSQLAAGSSTDPNAIHKNAAAEISTITEKVAPANADLLIIEDSADSNNKKKVQIGNLPSGGGGLTHAQVLARGLGA